MGSAARRFSEENVLDAQRQRSEPESVELGSRYSSDISTHSVDRPQSHREITTSVETYTVHSEPKVEASSSSGVFVRPRNFDRKGPIEIGSAASQFSSDPPSVHVQHQESSVPPPPQLNTTTRFSSDPAPTRKQTAR